MKLYNLFFSVLIGFSLLACNNGANQSENEEGADSTEATKSEGHEGHDHEGHDHGETSMEEGDGVHFGDKIDEEGAISVAKLEEKLNKEGGASEVKVKGAVSAVCQKKGCWMKMKKAEGEDIMITFKDYGFFVPKDLSGGEVVMEGNAYYDTLDVVTLRHYAEDAGKSKDQIAAITEPEIKMAFEATGVKILNQ